MSSLDELGGSIEGIIEYNLKKMEGTESNDMQFQLQLARMSFKKSTWEWFGRSCIDAPFYCVPHAGQIAAFGDFRNVPQQIQSACKKGIFRVVDAPVKSNTEEGETTVVSGIVDFEADLSTQFAREVLEESVRRYNSKRNFDPEESPED